MQTLKTISKILETWTGSHNQLNSYHFDNINNASTSNITYPMLWVQPVQSELYKLTFDIYIADILEEDRTNLIDVLSMMNDIAYDLNNYIELHDELDVDNISITPFESKFDDFTAGWIVNISIDYINPKNC